VIGGLASPELHPEKICLLTCYAHCALVYIRPGTAGTSGTEWRSRMPALHATFPFLDDVFPVIFTGNRLRQKWEHRKSLSSLCLLWVFPMFPVFPAGLCVFEKCEVNH
jgi:hypothetical protein